MRIGKDEVVGIIGVGDMGGPIAATLGRAGFEVLVYDLNADRVARQVEQGAKSAASVQELAARSRVVAVVVVDYIQLGDVVSQVFDAARPGTVVVVHSTVRPETVAELATEASARGFSLVDAPVTGGGDKASLGKLTVMVGGNEADVEFCMPLFEAIGEHVFYLGPAGTGQAMKITHNVMSLGSYAVYMDAMEFASSFGIDEDTVVTVAVTGQADSRGLRTWGRLDRFRWQHPGAGTPEIYTRISKDMRGAVAIGQAKGLTLPMVSAVAEFLPKLAARRDRRFTSNGTTPMTIPRCPACRQELASPFRVAGKHPEC